MTQPLSAPAGYEWDIDRTVSKDWIIRAQGVSIAEIDVLCAQLRENGATVNAVGANNWTLPNAIRHCLRMFSD